MRVNVPAAAGRLPCFCRQTYFIALLCGIDLTTTLWFCGRHGAAEANPLMSFFLSVGVPAFVLAKMGFTATPLAFLEWVRLTKPRLAVSALNTVIVAYLGIYAAGVAHINFGVSVDAAVRAANSDPELARVWGETRRRIEEKRRQGYRTVKSANSPVGGSKSTSTRSTRASDGPS